jgi:hypothetical protein
MSLKREALLDCCDHSQLLNGNSENSSRPGDDFSASSIRNLPRTSCKRVSFERPSRRGDVLVALSPEGFPKIMWDTSIDVAAFMGAAEASQSDETSPLPVATASPAIAICVSSVFHP